MDKREEIFRNTYLFSKKELLKSVRLMIKHIQKNDDEDKCSEKCMQKKVELFNEFKLAIEKSKLPTLTRLWWFYNYMFTGNAIELYLSSADGDFKIDEDECITGLSCSTSDTVLKVNCEYLTIEQFADMHCVSPATVHQWISSGKLRHAKKDGMNWLVPSVEDKPSRKYEPISYSWESPGEIQIDEFPTVSICNFISIEQEDETKFLCYFHNFEKDFREHIVLNRKEVESLEYALISSGKAYPNVGVYYMPVFEKNPINEET